MIVRPVWRVPLPMAAVLAVARIHHETSLTAMPRPQQHVKRVLKHEKTGVERGGVRRGLNVVPARKKLRHQSFRPLLHFFGLVRQVSKREVRGVLCIHQDL